MAAAETAAAMAKTLASFSPPTSSAASSTSFPPPPPATTRSSPTTSSSPSSSSPPLQRPPPRRCRGGHPLPSSVISSVALANPSPRTAAAPAAWSASPTSAPPTTPTSASSSAARASPTTPSAASTLAAAASETRPVAAEAAGAAGARGVPGRRRRPDLIAAKTMTDRGLWLHRDRRIVGPIPGVAVGDVFLYRAELCVLGVHGAVQAGIDFVPASQVPEGEPIAVSIVSSGGYQDDEDAADDVLVYTGSGGRVGRNSVWHSADQKLERGNLALERSMTYGIELRVVRAHPADATPTGRVYVYDGLYKVVDCDRHVGRSGCHVFRFKLLRMQGQDDCGLKNLKLAEHLKAQLAAGAKPEGYAKRDISRKRELLPVPLFNNIDEDVDPRLFDYVARPDFPSPAVAPRGCKCVADCSTNCLCEKRNKCGFAYSNGVLLRGRPVIFECGDSCKCPPTCPNRVAQKGMRHQLEVFRSRDTGWGVRSLDVIQAGSFVCELSGEVLTREEAKYVSAEHATYLIDPTRFPERWREWGDVSEAIPDRPPPEFADRPEPGYFLDVSRKRNVACYISHSSVPNVFVQFVLYGHEAESYPHIMIFAMENIPPLRELSIDYGIGQECVGMLAQ
uniref:Uncharacterized protein n=1 Tax=Ananas comosus var. bracteatus TaxID=296719 RepID=A0A6V7QD40_ANACO|nr:unnamed protein product [Ananas comosus var. bracteatus]